jgi:hypothetical protein
MSIPLLLRQEIDYFLSGEIFEGNIILNDESTSDPSKPITIGSYGEGRASIMAGKYDGILVKNHSGIIVQEQLW